MKINEKEIEAVSGLSPSDRYQYFIKRIADTETMFSLVNEQDELAIANLGDDNVISLWPARVFAESCKAGEQEDFLVKEISLDDFEDSVIDLIISNGYLLNVFSVNENSGFVVDLDEFARDLKDEFDKY